MEKRSATPRELRIVWCIGGQANTRCFCEYPREVSHKKSQTSTCSATGAFCACLLGTDIRGDGISAHDCVSLC